MAGTGAWISFLISAGLAALTGLTYAEFCSRVPKASGAAAFCEAAFRRPPLTFLIGFLVLASGLTSTATVSLAFQGYLSVFFTVPPAVAATGLILLITYIAWRGIGFAAWTNNVLTVLEACGLLLVISAGIWFLGSNRADVSLSQLAPGSDIGPLVAGATLAFYAFIGFEDLANLAEEAKNPRRDLPRAILIAVATSCALYLAVILIVTLVLGPEQAGASSRPLLDVLAVTGIAVPAGAFALLAIFAVTNTGLTNFVMVSRLLYGMSNQGLMPQAFGRVHPRRHTPWVAVLAAGGLTLTLAGTGGVKLLAQTTSLLLVIVFAFIHAGLVRVRRAGPPPEGTFHAPAFVPWAGFIACLFLGAHFPAGAFLRAGAVAAVALALYFFLRKRLAMT